MRGLPGRLVPPVGVFSAILASVLATAAFAAPPDAPSASIEGEMAVPATAQPSAAGRPNVVLVLTDDQAPSLTQNMKTVLAEIAARGVTFTDAHSTTPTCCPSRATLLSGNLAQSTGIWSNWLPDGGWELFHQLGGDDFTIAGAFDAAGYETAYVGKYLNGYGLAATRQSVTGDRDYVPPGWDSWHAFAKPTPEADGRHQGYYDYWLMDRVGQSNTPTYSYFGNATDDYSTDVLSARAVDVVESTPSDTPLFLLNTVFAPHKPYTVALRHQNVWNRVAITLPEGIGDTTGKPPWVQAQQRRGKADSAYLMREQARTLLSVDEGIGDLIDALERTGRLSNTLLIFASDNGLTLGQFNLLGMKNFPYSSPIPLIMRWDDAPSSSSLAHPDVSDGRLVSLADVTATMLDAAGITLSEGIDGVSLLKTRNRHSALTLSAAANRTDSEEGDATMPPYCARRTSRWLFVRYQGGFEELYDVRADPGLVANLAGARSVGAVQGKLRQATRRDCSPTPPGFSWR